MRRLGVRRANALALVGHERDRQERLKAAGRFEFTCADDGLTDAEKLATIAEEVGEVAQQVLAGSGLTHDTEGTREELRGELIQVAALSVAWIEALL